nr:alcohol dehydrogenase catalytic domain-containing protein [uncultured Eisenbergiella sp.]
MRAAIYYGKEDIRMEERDKPEIGAKDILVKNLYASICGTDAAVYTHGPGTGHRVTVGGEFGHEVVSEVIEVGNEVTDTKVGDRIYPYPREAKRDPRRAGTLVQRCINITVMSTRYSRQHRVVVGQRCHRIASLLRLVLTGISSTHYCNINATLYWEASLNICCFLIQNGESRFTGSAIRFPTGRPA